MKTKKWKMGQFFVPFSEYPNFTIKEPDLSDIYLSKCWYDLSSNLRVTKNYFFLQNKNKSTFKLELELKSTQHLGR